MCNLFQLQDKSLHNTRLAKALVQYHYSHVNNGLKSFTGYSTQLWNKLPNSIKNTADLESFKAMIDLWHGIQCKCNFCKSALS